MNQLPFKVNTNESLDCSREKTFLCEYRYKGATWCFEITAESYEEAQQKMKCVSQGIVLGEIKAKIPYSFGWVAKIWVWISRFFNL
uniref:OrfG n=1 Tax=Leptolyngbya sp. PCC 6402 TaxID=272136 RepID=Q60202_9CYAN|nr:OrfG [Leptolyngbya sp. PCC 6402]